MATIKNFEDLEIWQLAKLQADEFHEIMMTTELKADYSLRNQMNSSSGSVMDNIAEGFERSGNKDFKQFLIIAKGSNGEYRSQLFRCLGRNYINKDRFDFLSGSNITLGRKIMAFINYLQKSDYMGESRKNKESSTKP